MAEFPTYEEMAKRVAERALDEFLYNGKSIREWIQIIASEDCISRQEVLDLVNSDWKYEGLESDIENLPPVRPQEKVGHWVSFGVQGEVDGQIVKAFTCSECGAISLFRMIDGKIVNGDSCPNCRAKMKRSDKE